VSAKIDICNMAISHLAVGEEINDFDTDATESAQACRRFYDPARLKVLRDFDWPFASATVALSLVETDPTVEWGYSYRYPADALSLRRMPNGATRVDTQLSRALYSIGRDSAGKLIYAATADAEIQYTFDEDDAERFPPDFVIALSFYLAYLIANRVAGGGDVRKLKTDAYAGYRVALLEAMANAANEEPSDPPPEAEMISVRE
jgi:hypothetical protein